MKGIVLVLCGLIGYLVSRFLPEGALAIYAPMLISYHLLIGFLVVTTIQDKGVKLSITPAILTHFAFFVLLIVVAEARDLIPYFEYARFALPALALLESALLFSGKGKRSKSGDDVEMASGCSAEEYEEFIHYLRQNERTFSRPGASVKEEFNTWLAYRSKHQGLMGSGQRSA
jgi:hypothetical protein